MSERCEKLLDVESNAGHDLKLKADIKAEELIRHRLKHGSPFPILGEELGNNSYCTEAGIHWIVDPLDGTTNFLHGLPHFAVSIALEHRGKIVSGVVYDPAKDEMFVAEKGAGAWMNDSRIRVSDRRHMSESLYATGLPFSGRADLPDTLKDLAQLLPACAGVRRWGAAALDLAYVACGRYDGFWERNLKLWDIAAGLIIAREAGAIVEGVTPQTTPEETGDVLCANSIQFESLAKVIRRA